MSDGPREPRSPAFATTRWSVVLAARDREAPVARQALESLCTSYWYPLYAFTRRQGYDHDAAGDLTQAFFMRLLQTDMLRTVECERGRFRAFLLACMRHFLANERDRAEASKRGGGRSSLSIDMAIAEQRFDREPWHGLTPEKSYHRRWALTLLEEVLRRVRDDYVERGQQQLFDLLQPLITPRAAESFRPVAELANMSEGAVRVAVHRLRRRYGEALRQEIARTVDDPAEIDHEIRELFAALAP